MNCQQLQECLSEYVDGEILNPVERAEIEAHLATCKHCRKALTQVQKFTTTVVQTLQPIKPRADFTSRVLATAKSARASKSAIPTDDGRTWPLWPWLVGSGLVVVAGLFILFGGRPSAVGTVGRNGSKVKVYRYDGGGYRELSGAAKIPGGAQVEAIEGDPCPELELASGRLTMQGPMRATLFFRDETLVMTFVNAGRIFFRTHGRGKRPMEFEVNRIRVRVDVEGEGEKAVDVAVAASGTVTCAVMSGSACLTGPGADRPVVIAEGFQIAWPQEGPPGKPVTAPRDAFKWATGNE